MRALVLCLLPGIAWGQVFEPRALPVEHIYSGGWEHFVGGGVAVLDCNGDALPDFVAAGGASPARLFINESKAVGGDLTFNQGAFPELIGVTGAYPLDIDSDGYLDLAILRVGANVFLKGDGACGFTDHTAAWGIDPGDAWSTAFSAIWEAGETLPTMAIGNYVDRDDPDGPFEACDSNELLRPRADGRYDVTTLEPGFCALSMLFSDWNRSGVADLRVSNDRHYYVRGGSEQMWSMPDVTLKTGEGWQPISIWGMGIASRDLTGDGLPEVVLTSMGDQLMQIAGTDGYKAAPYDIGTYAQRPFIGDDGRPSTGWHAQFGDVNNDGHDDLFIAKGNVDQMPGNAMKDPNNLLIQGADGRFEERGDVAGIASLARSRGAALVDLNRDGLLDLVVVNRRAPVELYQNTTRDAGNWLGVELRQTDFNANAVGAWVELRVGDQLHAREITIGGGHAGGQVGALHFGLGEATRAELRVIWPGGATSEWQSIDAGAVHQITRN